MAREPCVELEIRYAGACRHPERMVIRGGRWRPVDFPALFAVLRHPEHGVTLFDTGYTERFARATGPFPARLYRWLTPATVRPDETAVAQLARAGVPASHVRRVVVSHFHADHVAGLRDFPDAELIASRAALAAVRGLGPIGSLRRGFLPALLPDDFDRRARLLDPAAFTRRVGPFAAHDLFGDGSVLLVRLPGHAAGQLGLVARTAERRRFLVADAAWTSASIRQLRHPNPLADLVLDDPSESRATLAALHRLAADDPTLDLVPSHCLERAAELGVRVDRAR
jgi:glyoxylase-like metal-dependent hydrolase (beta-lactamase superfamily II)